MIFSSPLSAYFLSLFNYFTLSSLYILLDIRLPSIVFYYLSLFYQACAGNIISELNIMPSASPFSPERVIDFRPLYFNVSSDLYSANYTSFIVILANVLLYEALLLFANNGPKCLAKVGRTLNHLKLEVYWGLIVSNVVPIILPWKYIIRGGSLSFAAKINLTAYYLLLLLLFFLLLLSFIK